MQYRPGRESDFTHLPTFVWQAIYPAFDLPDLSEEQRAENDRAVAEARDRVLLALTDPRATVITAWDERRRGLAGYIVVTKAGKFSATIDQLVVRRSEWGTGTAVELLDRAARKTGMERDLLVAVRPYNQRALAFFSKHGFEDTGESAGEVYPDRPLWRRAGEASVAATDGEFPTEADEPHFAPVYESLPDYNLATEELSAEPLFDPEQSSLDEQQLSELEAFIARAKAQKSRELQEPSEKKSPVESSTPTINYASKHPEIELEIDFGGEEPTDPEKGRGSIPFEFAFDETDTEPAPRRPEEVAQEETDTVIDDPLELREIPEPEPVETPRELRGAFEDQLGERLAAYFGADALPEYLGVYWKADNFHRIRDVALQGLTTFLNARPGPKRAARRRRNVIAELIEYFVVETAGAVHGGQIAQRVLRYQGADWKKVDLFKLVMDYLNFGEDADGVYTDFVSLPPRILKNATASYLQATRDERVFFIYDQSLFGSGKQGFAVTDATIYWKNILQPAGAATYTTLRTLERRGDHLLIDGQYFDAGKALNLRVALLLDKLRRMELDD
ncbi:GNAT family N-acetyltransferase [Neolewinella litorea]|uniref:GNAT family N-acetyltransferase n=1 Tax=Neolewinella litorea TaxID=2562452 RepID=A0A4S4NMM6_9BACT|nr:GNAT family N-acetyltransferase [Neolewinella litorea]THH41186.1 GNAT family N-acetyltransferase [Neolewinella litorea]